MNRCPKKCNFCVSV